MKKIAFISFLFLCATNVFAGGKDKFQFGVKVGLNLADQNFTGKKEFDQANEGSWNLLPGFTLGFIGEIPLASFLEIRLESIFASQGRQFSYKLDKNNWEKNSIAYGYVQFPVLLRGQFGNEKIRGFVHAGPQISVGVIGLYRDKFKIDGTRDSETETFNFKEEDLNRLDVGIDGGAGIEFKRSGFEIEVRYYKGLTDIVDYGDGERPNGVSKFTNSGISVNLGFKF